MVNGYAPTTLKEALQIRAEQAVTPYAGGTDLMVVNAPNQTYLFLNKIAELQKIEVREDCIAIGSGVTFTKALEHPDVPQLMKEALSRIAAPAIRNAGTFGGNLGNGSAKADSVLIEFVADAKLKLASVRGERLIDVNKFYIGRKQLDLAPDELIIEIQLPKVGLENYYYKKVGGRNALAISRVSYAAILTEKDGKIANFAVAFGAVAATVLRFPEVESMLIGKTIAEAKELKESLIEAYSERLVLTRGRVSAEYRKTVCLNLLRDSLEQFGI